MIHQQALYSKSLWMNRPFCLKQMKMTQKNRDEAEDGEEEHEVLDALHGICVMQRNLHDLRDVLRKKRDGDGSVEDRVRHARRLVRRQRHEDEADGKGDEKVRNLVAMMTHDTASSSFQSSLFHDGLQRSLLDFLSIMTRGGNVSTPNSSFCFLAQVNKFMT